MLLLNSRKFLPKFILCEGFAEGSAFSLKVENRVEMAVFVIYDFVFVVVVDAAIVVADAAADVVSEATKGGHCGAVVAVKEAYRPLDK